MSMTSAARAASIVRDAGGEIVGRTRLQKIAYLLGVAGLEDSFSFRYKHYGPFSEELANAAKYGRLLGQLQELERPTGWGGTYSIYRVNDQTTADVPPERVQLAKAAAEADAVELELAATAVFLASEGHENPWQETARRKPEKADADRLRRAKDLLETLRAIPTPIRLPSIN